MISFDLVAFLERRADAAHKAKSIDEYRSIVDELLKCAKELLSENASLREENTQLKDTNDLKKRASLYGSVMILKGETTPYCGVCWKDADKCIPLVLTVVGFGAKYMCVKCPNVQDSRIVEHILETIKGA